MRTNTGTGFGLWNSDLVLALTRFRIAEACGISYVMFEPVNVLHYDPGQKFDLHYDYIDPTVDHFADDLRLRGQRMATALVYLNDGYEGGETDFPEIGYGFKGDTGDLLVFFNVTEDGSPDPRTLHAGTPPTSGDRASASSIQESACIAVRAAAAPARATSYSSVARASPTS